MLSHREILGHHLDSSERVLQLIEFARHLRQTSTDAESLLWSCLRDRRMNGRKFRRQHPVQPYILDFFCPDLQLGLELDGSQHRTEEGQKRDAVRAAFLSRKGIQLLRFTNHDVLTNLDGVLLRIWKATDDRR
jgi:very-short-patch-repair endonuclease